MAVSKPNPEPDDEEETTTDGHDEAEVDARIKRLVKEGISEYLTENPPKPKRTNPQKEKFTIFNGLFGS